MYKKLLTDIQILKGILVFYATGGTVDSKEYQELRGRLISNKTIKNHLPSFLKICRNLEEFWGYIKEQSKTYQGKREHLREAFDPALTYLEEMSNNNFPIDDLLSSTIKSNAYTYIQESWEKALERRVNDPEGAITMARTLLETTFKHILEESQTEYDEKAELPQLYKSIQGVLKLAPSEYTEQTFKMILSGCVSVVTGLGSLRNKLSDSHGMSQKSAKPSPRHALLAVNLSGSMAEFIISSWEEHKTR